MAPRVLVIACGALAKEILEIVSLSKLEHITVECLPARFHNEPDLITDAVKGRIDRARERGFDRILIGYADCGTGGHLDHLCRSEGVEMLEGPHCYQFFAGAGAFSAMHEDQLGTLYLTDFFARHFERLIWHGLGIADHPELLDMYFANYTRVMYLAQTDNPELEQMAREAANRLGLTFEKTVTGYGELEPALIQIGAPA